jgi:hypothetical protein
MVSYTVVAVQAETEAARPATMTAERILILVEAVRKIEKVKSSVVRQETNVSELVKEWTTGVRCFILKSQLVGWKERKTEAWGALEALYHHLGD